MSLNMKIGEIISNNDEIVLNSSGKTKEINVSNTGDRPIQVGSHFHFFETNKFLDFPRKESFGYRLDIPSGTSVRFEPGETKSVQLVELGGKKRVFGLNDLICGQTNQAAKIKLGLED